MTDIPNQTKWVKVFQDLATDLKAEVALAALSEIIVKQSTAANLCALVTLAGLRGIIPNPINATRIDIYAGQDGVGTTVVYTVPANKILFIGSAWFSAILTAAGWGDIYFFSRNVADVLDKTLLAGSLNTLMTVIFSNQYFRAIEVPAGYDVVVNSGHANINVKGGIHGWLEDV